MGLGLIRAGWLGGLAAWAGFTLPSCADGAGGVIALPIPVVEGGWVQG